jgi:hypothetical protein
MDSFRSVLPSTIWESAFPRNWRGFSGSCFERGLLVLLLQVEELIDDLRIVAPGAILPLLPMASGGFAEFFLAPLAPASHTSAPRL